MENWRTILYMEWFNKFIRKIKFKIGGIVWLINNGTTEPLNSNDKLNTVYYSPKKNIAPIKKKKKKKKDFFETVGDVIEGTGKTILNTGIEIGKGAVDFGEKVLDTGITIRKFKI